MKRRQFLTASIAASAIAAAGDVAGQAPAASLREFYLMRRYTLLSGQQTKLTESYFGDALIPALARMGMGPIGAFKLDIGPETPAYYLLIPGPSVEALAELDLRLAGDAGFMKAAAFEGWPRATPPAASAAKGKRIFQLRTYESPSNADHVRKVEMFHSGEFEIFKSAGFHPVFFGDTLIAARMPSLTYMLSFTDMAELEKQWDTFRNDSAWKKLSGSPRYSFDNIVTSITNLILSPLACSQI